jgi:hypothetical protein
MVCALVVTVVGATPSLPKLGGSAAVRSAKRSGEGFKSVEIEVRPRGVEQNLPDVEVEQNLPRDITAGATASVWAGFVSDVTGVTAAKGRAERNSNTTLCVVIGVVLIGIVLLLLARRNNKKHCIQGGAAQWFFSVFDGQESSARASGDAKAKRQQPPAASWRLKLLPVFCSSTSASQSNDAFASREVNNQAKSVHSGPSRARDERRSCNTLLTPLQNDRRDSEHMDDAVNGFLEKLENAGQLDLAAKMRRAASAKRSE